MTVSHPLDDPSYEELVYSETGYMTPSSTPEMITLVETTVGNDFVRIAWDETPSDRGATVTKYRIYIVNYDTGYSAESAWCFGNGTAHPTGDQNFVFEQRWCEVPMADLWNVDTWAFTQGQTIKATVEAWNLRGWSVPSDEMTDEQSALVEVVPHQLNTPWRGETSGEFQLEIDWDTYETDELDDTTALRLDGGRAIISYEL